MAISQLYPNQRPTLNLNFARSKTLDPRITFTRNSIATYVGSDGLIKTAAANEVRFDHDPATGESLGLLIEEDRANHCRYSAIDTTNWTEGGTSSLAVSSVSAPDGGTCHDLTTDTGGANSVYVSNTSAPVGTAILSVFARFPNAGFTSLVVRCISTGGGANFYASYIPATDSWAGEASCTGLPSEDFGNGWKRLTVVSTVTSSNGNNEVRIGGGIGQPAFTNQTCQIWGAQLEQGSFPTSYIPTSGSTYTRVTDLATLSNTDWFNSNEGTFVLNVDALGSSDDYPRLLQTNQSHNFEYQTLNSAPTAKSLAFQQWLTGQSTKTPYGIAPLGEFKTAAGYSIGNLSPIYIDGTEQVRGIFYSPGTAIGTPPTELRIFTQGGGGQQLSGYLKSLRYYPTNFNNDALEALTK